MVASRRGTPSMPDVRPTKRPKNMYNLYTPSSSPSPPPRNTTTLPFKVEDTCKFRVTVLIGVPLDSTDGRDRWFLQVNVGDHCGHFPHKCGVHGKPLRIKDEREVKLSVQVRLCRPKAHVHIRCIVVCVDRE